MNKHLRGYRKNYFSLSNIAMYSTLFKLCRADVNFMYHFKAYELIQPAQAPPSEF